MKMKYIRKLLKLFFILELFVVITACPRETLHDGLSVGIDEYGVFFINERMDIGIYDIFIYTGGDIMFGKIFVDVEDKTSIRSILLENQGDQWKSGKNFQYSVDNPFLIMTNKASWKGIITIYHKEGKIGETVDFADIQNLRVEIKVKDVRQRIVYTKEAVGENFYK